MKCQRVFQRVKLHSFFVTCRFELFLGAAHSTFHCLAFMALTMHARCILLQFVGGEVHRAAVESDAAIQRACKVAAAKLADDSAALEKLHSSAACSDWFMCVCSPLHMRLLVLGFPSVAPSDMSMASHQLPTEVRVPTVSKSLYSSMCS